MAAPPDTGGGCHLKKVNELFYLKALKISKLYIF